MAALRTGSVVKLHHLGGCSYRVGIARCEIASLVRRAANRAAGEAACVDRKCSTRTASPINPLRLEVVILRTEKNKSWPGVSGDGGSPRRQACFVSPPARANAVPSCPILDGSDRSLSRRCPWRRVMVPAAGQRASPVQARSKAICGRCLPDHRAQARSAGRLACARSES